MKGIYVLNLVQSRSSRSLPANGSGFHAIECCKAFNDRSETYYPFCLALSGLEIRRLAAGSFAKLKTDIAETRGSEEVALLTSLAVVDLGSKVIDAVAVLAYYQRRKK